MGPLQQSQLSPIFRSLLVLFPMLKTLPVAFPCLFIPFIIRGLSCDITSSRHPFLTSSSAIFPSRTHDIFLACTLRDSYHIIFNYFLISLLLYAIILNNKSGFLFIFEFRQLGRHSAHTIWQRVANVNFSAQYVWFLGGFEYGVPLLSNSDMAMPCSLTYYSLMYCGANSTGIMLRLWDILGVKTLISITNCI